MRFLPLFRVLCLSFFCLSLGLSSQAQDYEVFQDKNGFYGLRQGKKTLLKAQYLMLEPIDQEGFGNHRIVACLAKDKKAKFIDIQYNSFQAPLGWIRGSENPSCQCGIWDLSSKKWLLPAEYKLLVTKQVAGYPLVFAGQQLDIPIEQGKVFKLQDQGPALDLKIPAAFVLPSNENQYFETRDSQDLARLHSLDAQGQVFTLPLPPAQSFLHLNPQLILAYHQGQAELYNPQGQKQLPQALQAEQIQMIHTEEQGFVALLGTSPQGSLVFTPKDNQIQTFPQALRFTPLHNQTNPNWRHFLLEGRQYLALLSFDLSQTTLQTHHFRCPPKTDLAQSGRTLVEDLDGQNHFTFALQTPQGILYYLPETKQLSFLIQNFQENQFRRLDLNSSLLWLGFQTPDNQTYFQCLPKLPSQDWTTTPPQTPILLDSLRQFTPRYAGQGGQYLIQTKQNTYGLWQAKTQTWVLQPEYRHIRHNEVYRYQNLPPQPLGETLNDTLYLQDKQGQWWLQIKQQAAQKIPPLSQALPLRWSLDLQAQATFRHQILYHQGRLYLGVRSQNKSKQGWYEIQAQNGQILYHHHNKNNKYDQSVSGLAIANHTLFWGSRDSTLNAFDLKTRKLRWQYKTQALAEISPNLADLNQDQFPDAVFVLRQPAQVIALNGKTGQILWQHLDNNPQVYHMAPALSLDLNQDQTPDFVLGSASNQGSIYALDGQNGQELWSIFPGSGTHTSPQLSYWNQDGQAYILALPSYGPALIISPEGHQVHSIYTPIGNFSSPLQWGDSLLLTTQAWDKQGGFALIRSLEEEILEQGGQKQLRNPLYSLATEPITAAPLLATLNGQQELAWLFTEAGLCYGLNQQGQIKALFTFEHGTETTPLLVDVDGDGLQELFILSNDGQLRCYQQSRP